MKSVRRVAGFSLLVSALVAPSAQGLDHVSRLILARPLPGLATSDFWVFAVAVYFAAGLVARWVAAGWGSWYAMVAGAFAGGFVYEVAVLTLGVNGIVFVGGWLAPMVTGFMAAWATATVGSFAFGLAAVVARRPA